MSRWVHIRGVIRVDTFTEIENIEKYIEKELAEAPKIHGSEGDARYYVNSEEKFGVYNSSLICSSKTTQFQTCVTITVDGDLRDTEMEIVEEEYRAFLDYLYNKRWLIEENVCVINDELIPMDKIIHIVYQGTKRSLENVN